MTKKMAKRNPPPPKNVWGGTWFQNRMYTSNNDKRWEKVIKLQKWILGFDCKINILKMWKIGAGCSNQDEFHKIILNKPQAK